MTAKNELAKLQQDMAVYCRELKLSHRVKLLLVVDFWPVCYFRIVKHCLKKKKWIYTALRYMLLPLRPLVLGISGSRIGQGAEIGGGLFLHYSEGIVIGSSVTIGENCSIYTGCCLVHKADGTGGSGPTVADNVRLMVGSKIIGPVFIGSRAVVGANAVVLKDVPAHAIAVGVPAKILTSA